MRSLLLSLVIAAAGCTPTTYQPFRDSPDYVDRVIEDVTAILEGMAQAHADDQPRVVAPAYRSFRQPPSP